MTKHFAVLFSWCLFISTACFAQKIQKAYIKQQFSKINADKSLRKVVLENEDFLNPLPDGGGILTGYYKGNELVKIVRWVGISHGNEVAELYFEGSQLIFLYAEFNSFIYDSTADSIRFGETERTFEGRFWFNQGKLIDHVTKGHNSFEDDDFDPAITWQAEAKKLMLLLERKRCKLCSR